MRLTCFLLLLACACSTTGKQGAEAPGSQAGEVLERSEGYSERPGWADENQPWSRGDSEIRVLGYVAIRGDQRMAVGNRAADSYARAELMRFLSVRVVALLEDSVAAGEPDLLRESIEVTAQGVIDDLPVSGRYYERRTTGSDEMLHIFSRIDLDKATVLKLMQQAASNTPDLRTTPEELLTRLQERWDRVADVDELNQDETLLPNGFPRPKWAEKGDRTDDAGFEFVCSGIAENPKAAQAVAQARCNEKLCRLFGVQITASTTVTEDLDGIDAQSQVTEQCANVRVEGRKTRYQSSECGPQGCVHWFLQSYPRSAYVAERKRLDQPQVIQQQVVIQEGGIRYRDPEACEKSIRAYGAVKEQSSTGFLERKKHLTHALKYCQGIDGRESGLFLSLNTLLLKPLDRFARAKPTRYYDLDSRWAFTIVSPEWRDEFDTKRFLTDRIQNILSLVDGAILPLQLLEYREIVANKGKLDRAIREVMAYPFTNKPLSEHHLYYIHDSVFGSVRKEKANFSSRYRRYLLSQVSRSQFTCYSKESIDGEAILSYLSTDGKIDNEEWKAGIAILKNSEANRRSRCIATMFRQPTDKETKSRRIEEVARMISSDSSSSTDSYRAFEQLLKEVDPDDILPLYYRHRAKLHGSDKARQSLIDDITDTLFGWDWDYQDKAKAQGIKVCNSLPQNVTPFFKQVPDAKTEETALCMCLKLDGLASSARRSIAALLSKKAEKTCSWIKPADWPGTYLERERPKVIPFRGPTPFVGHFKFIEDEIKACIDKHAVTRSPYMVTFLTVNVTRTKMSSSQAETTIYGKLKDFKYRDNRPGYVQAEDVLKMEKDIEGCIERAANQYVVSEKRSITTYPGTHRLWFQIWGVRTGTNGLVSELNTKRP